MAGSTQASDATTLGGALKHAREARGVSLRKLAELMGRKPTDSGLISRWETGERKPKPEDVAGVIEALGIDDDEATELHALAVGSGQDSGWHAVTLPGRRQQLNALLAAERKATTVTQVAPLIVPGVLQTTDVIRAVMTEGDVPADEIDERVAIRVGRRDLITRRNPARLEVLLGEAAIRHVVGGRQVWADQLRYLNEVGQLPNVELRVVPFGAGWNAGQVGAFILLDSDEAPSIVSIDLHGGGLLLYADEEIRRHRLDADAARSKALKVEDSARFIAHVRAEMEKPE